MLELGIVSGAAFKSALVGVKLMYDSFACWRKHSRALIQRKTRGPRNQSSLIHRSRVL
jgi:hypothetical protein